MLNIRTKLLLFFGFIWIIFPSECVFGQRFDKGFDFDSIYNKGLAEIKSNLNGSKQNLKKLMYYEKQFTPVEKAKTNYLRLRVIYADTMAVKALEKRMFAAPDSLGYYDARIYSAKKYLEKSMPDKAIHLLMQALDTSKTCSEKTDICRINLCEAYRQKQEYAKGIEILNEILRSKRKIQDDYTAYAYNRMAAIYNEWGNPKFNTSDSIIKYSELCMSLSKKIGSKSNLAFSQNEIIFQKVRNKQYSYALELSNEAVENFKEAEMPSCAINALINQSNIYITLHKFDLALKVVIEASNLCSIEENRNLFKRLYTQFAKIYSLKANYKDAYDFLIICYQLQNDFFVDRINNQINEQSAKYDLLSKEQKIQEEVQKNVFQKKQLIFLIIILVFLCLAFFVSYLYFRLKRKEIIKQKTLEAVIQTEEKERKRIASDLHDGLGPLLSAAKLYFQAYIDSKEISEKKDIETKLKKIMENAIYDTSRISHNISPQILENYGLIIALENFISDINISGKIKFDIKFDKIKRFGLKEELTIYRTISELINNTLKHAQATLISLNIFITGDVLNMEYIDNGKGFLVVEKMHAKQGMGLSNIESRIQSLGGNIFIESLQGQGMKVEIKIPYKETKIDESN